MRIWRMFWIAGITLALDRFSKFLVERMMAEGESIPVIHNFFYLTYIKNKGIAFGLFSPFSLPLIIVSFLVIAAILLYSLRATGRGSSIQVGLGLILGGALGNLMDRIKGGAVIDFLNLRIWPVFNLADVAIIAGVGTLLWKGIRRGKSEEAKEEVNAGV